MSCNSPRTSGPLFIGYIIGQHINTNNKYASLYENRSNMTFYAFKSRFRQFDLFRARESKRKKCLFIVDKNTTKTLVADTIKST